VLEKNRTFVRIPVTDTETPQTRRKSIIKQGIDVFEKFRKKKIELTLELPPRPRVLDYERDFTIS